MNQLENYYNNYNAITRTPLFHNISYNDLYGHYIYKTDTISYISEEGISWDVYNAQAGGSYLRLSDSGNSTFVEFLGGDNMEENTKQYDHSELDEFLNEFTDIK